MENATQIGKDGRITIPASIRAALGIKPGDVILVRLENSSIRVIPLKQAVQLAQQTLRKYVPEDTSLVEALVRARREEAAHE